MSIPFPVRRLTDRQAIELGPHVYHMPEGNVVEIRGSNIVVKGEVGTVLDGNGETTFFRTVGADNYGNNTFKDFEIRNCARGWVVEARQGNNHHDWTWENIVARDLNMVGADNSMIFAYNLHSATIEHCAMANGGLHVRDHGLIYAAAKCTDVFLGECFVTNVNDMAQIRGTGTIVDNCVAFGVERSFLDLWGGTNMEAVAEDGIDATVYNNLFVWSRRGRGLRLNAKVRNAMTITHNVLTDGRGDPPLWWENSEHAAMWPQLHLRHNWSDGYRTANPEEIRAFTKHTPSFLNVNLILSNWATTDIGQIRYQLLKDDPEVLAQFSSPMSDPVYSPTIGELIDRVAALEDWKRKVQETD